MDRDLEELVRTRAAGRCEYCRMPQEWDKAAFELDHIIALVHGGATLASNLALSCWYCNCFKGPNLAGIDSVTGRVIRLFHPRKHKWSHHFAWEGPVLVGRTDIGRATIAVLRINLDHRVQHRKTLIDLRLFAHESD